MPLPPATIPARTDDELLRRSAQGDQTAFEELYDRFATPLFSLAHRMLGDPREAEDLLQELFARLWEQAHHFDPSRGSAFSWTVSMVRSRAIDRLRARERRSRYLAGPMYQDPALMPQASTPAAADTSMPGGEQAEFAGLLRQALGQLPGEQRQPIEMAFFGGLTHVEISSRLQVPLGTIKARIRRGLLRLRESVGRLL